MFQLSIDTCVYIDYLRRDRVSKELIDFSVEYRSVFGFWGQPVLESALY